MKIHVKTVVGGPDVRYRMSDYKVVRTESCCDEMQSAYDRRAVDVCVDGFERAENLSLAMVTAIYTADGGESHSTAPIKHCPWCGAPATFEVVETVPTEQPYPEIHPETDF